MASKAIEREAAQLRGELNRHNYLYYVEAQPAISDREYDRLMMPEPDSAAGQFPLPRMAQFLLRQLAVAWRGQRDFE